MKLKRKTVLGINTVVFGLVALLHLLRVLFGVELMIGSTQISAMVSVIAVAFIGYLGWNNYMHFVEHK